MVEHVTPLQPRGAENITKSQFLYIQRKGHLKLTQPAGCSGALFLGSDSLHFYSLSRARETIKYRRLPPDFATVDPRMGSYLT